MNFARRLFTSGSKKRFPEMQVCIKKIVLPFVMALLLIVGCSTAAIKYSLNRHTGFANVLQSIAFSPNGKFLAAGGWAGENYVELYDAETLKLIKTIQRKPVILNNTPFISFSPDRKHLATCSLDDPMIVWDLETSREFLNFPDFTSVSEAVYASDGRILNLSQLKIVWEVAYTPDGKNLATAGPRKEAHLFEAITGRERAVLSGHTGDVKCLAFSRNGKLLATGASDGEVLLWDVVSAKNIAKTDRHRSPVTSLSFSADDTRLLSMDYQEANIWSLASPNPSGEMVKFGDHCFAEEGNPDRVAILSLSETIAVPVSPLINKGQYSPDGKYLALKSYNESRYRSFDMYRILIRNLATGETRTIKGTYLDFVFSPDGKRLATAGRGVKLWNPETATEIAR